MSVKPVTVEEGGKAEKIFQRLVGLFSVFLSWMNSAGTLWIFAIMFFIIADIIARSGFGVPLRGVPELVAYSIIGAVFLQFAHALHSERFTRADMFIEPLEKKRPVAAGIFNLVFNLGGILVFALIAYGTYFKLLEAWPDLKFGVEGDFTILVWPLRAVIMFGATAVAIEYTIRVIRSANSLVKELQARTNSETSAPLGLGYVGILVVIFALVVLASQSGLDKTVIGALSLIGMLLLIFTGVHIGVALIALGFTGIVIIFDGDTRIAVNAVKLASNEFLRNYFFGVVPLFVLMGLLVNESDIGKDTFNVARWALRNLKGGLGIATVVANAIFAAITGSSIASAAVFTKVAAPQMMNHGYSAKFAVGTVAGSSVLGMLIPPSLLLIIYGFVAEQSVGVLFLAAVIPGIILAFAMGLSILAMAHFWPAFVGNPTHEDLENENIASATWKLFPIIILIVAVLGGIYGGIFTPVEAGAVGAAGALVIAVLKRRLTWSKLWRVLVETGHTTVSVLFLILAANIFGRMLALSGFPQAMGEFIANADVGFYGFMVMYLALVIILGMFLDSISLMLIVLPLVLPIVQGFGKDLIWFGIVTVIAVEMGLLTPPLGIAVYVVKSTIDDARVSLNQIFAGAFPYVIIMLFVTILLIIFPELSLMIVN